MHPSCPHNLHPHPRLLRFVAIRSVSIVQITPPPPMMHRHCGEYRRGNEAPLVAARRTRSRVTDRSSPYALIVRLFRYTRFSEHRSLIYEQSFLEAAQTLTWRRASLLTAKWTRFFDNQFYDWTKIQHT